MDVQRSCVLIINALAESPRPGFDIPIFILMIICIILSSFFSMAETAFSSVNQVRLRLHVENGKKGAKKALDIAVNYNRTLTTVLVGNNIVNITLATIAVRFFSQLLTNSNMVEFISTLIITAIVLVFGEILPKTISKLYPEEIALKIGFIVYIFSGILYPIVILFIGFQRLLQKNRKNGPEVDEAELEVILDTMEEDGTIESEEVEMIQNILDLNDRSVRDIMTPRINIIAIDCESDIESVKKIIFETKYSRVPVFKGDKDNIIGILYEREFLTNLILGEEFSIKDLIHEAFYVSESMKVNALIHELQHSKVHIAIVSGEYGETVGIVTMEDALEELVGEIYDEHDSLADDEFIKKMADDHYLINAEIFLEDLFDDLQLGRIPEDHHAKLSGWLYEVSEMIPKEGFSYTYVTTFIKKGESEDYNEYTKKLIFTVTKVHGRRIMEVELKIENITDEIVATEE